MNWKFWKKKPVKPLEPFVDSVIDGNKITILCKSAECEEFLKLLEVAKENVMRQEMLDIESKKTDLRKGQVLAYDQLIANISEIRKEEIVYARKSEPTQ